MKKKYVEEKENIVVVPDYANFIAVDSDGDEYAFAEKPMPYVFNDKELGYWSAEGSDCDQINTVAPPKDFQNELYTWK